MEQETKKIYEIYDKYVYQDKKYINLYICFFWGVYNIGSK